MLVEDIAHVLAHDIGVLQELLDLVQLGQLTDLHEETGLLEHVHDLDQFVVCSLLA
jgi:hypothetical protein